MRRRIIVAVVLLVGLAGAIFFFGRRLTTPVEPVFGTTFSANYARELGLDYQQAYLAILDDLGVKKMRLPVYWSEIEPRPGEFDWTSLDFLIEEAARRRVELTLVVGRKVPRWPECFIPDWAEGLTGPAAEEALLKMERTVVGRYKSNPAVLRWQVENEPFLPFGVCPAADQELLDREISLVRSLDNRPIILTVSGELDPWWSAARASDILGISTYRVSWTPLIGLFPYPLQPLVYRLRALPIRLLLGKQVIVVELQAEPWFVKAINEMSETERAAAFTPQDLLNNAEFAARAGFSEIYLWGVEWWYAEKTAGRPELWGTAKEIF